MLIPILIPNNGFNVDCQFSGRSICRPGQPAVSGQGNGAC
jgi:hypothetical protein